MIVDAKSTSTNLPLPLLLPRLGLGLVELEAELVDVPALLSFLEVSCSCLSWFCPPAGLSMIPSSSSSELSDMLLRPPNCCLDRCSA